MYCNVMYVYRHLAQALAPATESAMLFSTWCCLPQLHALTFPFCLYHWLSLSFNGHMSFGLCPSLFCSPHWVCFTIYWSHSYWSHGPRERAWLSRVSTSSCTRSCSYIGFYLSNSHHWDSHCWRTWSTSTIQGILIQRLFPTKEG